MSDENDLDAFARLFGAHPETPPEGLLPVGEARPTPSAPADGTAGPAAAGDPLAWLLSDTAAAATTAFPSQDPPTMAFGAGELFAPATSYPTSGYSAPAAAYPAAPPADPAAAFPNHGVEFADPAAAFAYPAATADATQVLPTRRSVAADAARASRETGRRNLIILGSISALVLVLIVVLIVVLVSKSASSGSPDALLRQPVSPSVSSGVSSSATASATPTPTPTTETPTPTPTPTQARTAAPPPPAAPTVTASVTAQPTCAPGATTTFSIGYTSANAETLNLSSSDGAVNTNLTPAASGTISSVTYHCDAHPSYTLTVYSSAEGLTPGTATVTPVPTP